MSKNKTKQTVQKTNAAYMFWKQRTIRLASSSIQWKGLPDYLDTSYLELCLNLHGSAMIAYDSFVDRYFLGGNASCGNLDNDGYPEFRKLIFRNGNIANFDPENSVIIYNNCMRSSDIFFFDYIASRMCNIDVAVDVNINTQKTMPIIPTSQERQLSVENIMQAMINNNPYLLVENNGINLESFSNALVFDNKKSFTGDNMTAVQREIWQQFLTFIGLNNANTNKKERSIVPEVNANLDEILAMRRDRLNAREQGCKQLKLVLGLDVEAQYYSDEFFAQGYHEYMIGGDNSGTINSRAQNNL